MRRIAVFALLAACDLQPAPKPAPPVAKPVEVAPPPAPTPAPPAVPTPPPAPAPPPAVEPAIAAEARAHDASCLEAAAHTVDLRDAAATDQAQAKRDRARRHQADGSIVHQRSVEPQDRRVLPRSEVGQGPQALRQGPAENDESRRRRSGSNDRYIRLTSGERYDASAARRARSPRTRHTAEARPGTSSTSSSKSPRGSRISRVARVTTKIAGRRDRRDAGELVDDLARRDDAIGDAQLAIVDDDQRVDRIAGADDDVADLGMSTNERARRHPRAAGWSARRASARVPARSGSRLGSAYPSLLRHRCLRRSALRSSGEPGRAGSRRTPRLRPPSRSHRDAPLARRPRARARRARGRAGRDRRARL